MKNTFENAALATLLAGSLLTVAAIPAEPLLFEKKDVPTPAGDCPTSNTRGAVLEVLKRNIGLARAAVAAAIFPPNILNLRGNDSIIVTISSDCGVEIDISTNNNGQDQATSVPFTFVAPNGQTYNFDPLTQGELKDLSQ